MSTRRTRGAVLAIVAGALVMSACSSDDDAGAADTRNNDATGTTSAANATVVIDDVRFVDGDVEVQAGGTVTFDNRDSQAHTATADDGEFDTDTIDAGSAQRVTLEEVGEFTFHCSFHPFMTGTVVVK
jgi:plastocyanin